MTEALADTRDTSFLRPASAQHLRAIGRFATGRTFNDVPTS